MILPDDLDLIESMVGRQALDFDNLPKEFVEEYLTRLGMMSRAGKSGPLGPVAIMQLLRDMHISPEGKTQLVTVKDWSNVASGTVIVYEGRRGIFQATSVAGMVLIKLDGYRAMTEVPASLVTLAVRKVDGIDDEAFKAEPAPPAAIHTRSQDEIERDEARAKVSPEEQSVLNTWGMLEAGDPVKVAQADGTVVDGEFIDVAGDKLLVMVGSKRTRLAPSVVSKAEPQPA